jgi:hypothetical protein
MDIKLAEALLRRKELAEKVAILKHFKDKDIYYEIRGQRNKITEGVDEMNANIPKMTASQVTAEYDFAAKQLRLVDAVIQQANWSTVIQLDPMVMEIYVAPAPTKIPGTI